MDEKQYDEILEEIKAGYWAMIRSERRHFIEKLVKNATKGKEEELKQLFEIGKKEKDIPKKLKYSYQNLIEALLDATNLFELDKFDV